MATSETGTRPGPAVAGRERGNFLDDFRPGQVFEHWPGRTITEADNIQFSLLTMNQHPIHCDAAFAARSEFGRPLVNSALTLAIVTGMTVNDISLNAIANLGWKEVRLVAPVFPGDTIYARTQVLEVRESRSRPGQGIVTTRTEGYKADGTVFLTFERASLMPRRGYRGP
ncbi:MaoC family dehydratase [Caldovatus sediminis]|uniref:MaoC family dehydratase n=1 Tax=Caldovatus sediminis TaxID=2041189 RepID=A0A8J2ZED9_9PROT|nr:MaoC family dehydratase [Caldovatus sediminis]GGG44806.1 MaoC family dehydratase [Caldovatus sediminis]